MVRNTVRTSNGCTTAPTLMARKWCGRGTWARNRIRNCCVIFRTAASGRYTPMNLRPGLSRTLRIERVRERCGWKCATSSFGRTIVADLVAKQKRQRLRKSVGPCSLIVGGSLFDHHPETLLVQSRPAQDYNQFAHIVDNALISVFPPGFRSARCKKHTLRPEPFGSTLLDRLLVRSPKRRTLEQQSAN